LICCKEKKLQKNGRKDFQSNFGRLHDVRGTLRGDHLCLETREGKTISKAGLPHQILMTNRVNFTKLFVCQAKKFWHTALGKK